MTPKMGRIAWRRRRAGVWAGMVAVVALTACSAESSPSPQDQDDAALPLRAAEPGKPVSDQEIEQLDIGIMGTIPQLDPVANIEAGLSVNMNALEPLLRVDSKGEIQPWLATGFDAVSATVYEYTLREGVKFWDGTELTSEDVKYTWDRQMELDDRSGFASVDSVEATDTYTVRVTLTKPDASWKYTPTLFYAVIYQKEFTEQAGKDFGQPDTLVMGTGPWQIDSLNPTTSLELSAFEDYWGGTPPIGRVSVKFFSADNSMALALRAGEIDLAEGIASPEGFDATAGGGTLTTVPTCATAFVSIPTRTAPWDDVHVRRAVAYGLNRDDIIAATRGRAGGPLEMLISPMLMQPLGTEDEVQAALDSVPTYPHDVEKAKAELAKSTVPDGFTTKFKVLNSDAAVAEVIAAQMTAIGIDTEAVTMQDTAWYAEIGKEDPPFTFTETGACVPDPSWDGIFLATDDSGEPTGINIAKYAPPGMPELVEAGLATEDPAMRLEVYTEILQQLGEDVPYVPVYAEGKTYASTTYDVVEYGSNSINYPWLLNVVAK